MNPRDVVLYVFLLLTAAFSAMLLWRIWPSRDTAESNPGTPQRFMKPTSAGGETAEAIEALGEAVEKILAAAGTFGKTINAIGPTAIAGVFAAFFGFLTAIVAFLRP